MKTARTTVPTPDESTAEEAPAAPASVARTRFSEVIAFAERRWFVTFGVAVVLGSIGAFVLDELGPEVLPPGTRAWGRDVASLAPGRARLELEKRSRELEGKALTAAIDGKDITTSFAEAGLSVDWQATFDARAVARQSQNVAARFASWLRDTVSGPRELEPKIVVDAARLTSKLDALEAAAVSLPFPGGFKLEGGQVLPDYPRSGRRLERRAGRKALEEALARGSLRAVLPTVPIDAPYSRPALDALVASARSLAAESVVLEDEALARKLVVEREELLAALRVEVRAGGTGLGLSVDAPLLLEKLAERRAKVENEARPARFEIDATERVHVLPSEPERRLVAETFGAALLDAAGRPERRGALPLAVVAEPTLTTERAKALGIRGLVSTFTTRHPCCERRVENIHRIADLLDGLVVEPGQTVSVNEVVGPRTTKNGFVPAPTIEEGEMVDTLGGGISQFATTLFNALFHGGYEIIERQPHSYWFPRYPMGHEATLSYPKPDVIFRNDTDAGMLFDTRYTKTSITVRIFGDNGGRRVVAEVSSRKNVVEPTLEILGNPALPPDKERVVQAGMIGWSVTVARIVHMPDGTKREERRKVTYKPKARRVEVHPCRVPEGEKGYTGERCPEVEESEGEDTADPGNTPENTARQ